MSTIMDYVNELERQKRKLVSILNTLNVQSDDTETFNELIPKILQIYGITYFIHCKDKFSPITVDKATGIAMTPFSDNIDASAQVTKQQGIVEEFTPIRIESKDVTFTGFGETISSKLS